MMRSDHQQMDMESVSKGFLAPQSAFLVPCQFLEFVQPKKYYPMLTQTASTTTVGKWSKKQQKAYLEFLIKNRELFASKSVRKSKKVFLNMSHIITTRTAEQCRTHHQKMLKYNNSIDDILLSYGEIVADRRDERTGSSQRSSEVREEEPQEDFYYMEMVDQFRVKLVINADSILSY